MRGTTAVPRKAAGAPAGSTHPLGASGPFVARARSLAQAVEAVPPSSRDNTVTTNARSSAVRLRGEVSEFLGHARRVRSDARTRCGALESAVNRRRLFPAEHTLAAPQMLREQATRQHQHTTASGKRTVEVGRAVDKKGLHVAAGHALEPFPLRIGLPEHPPVNPVDTDASAVALRLDREKTPRADHHMVDVAATGVDVVQRKPAVPEPLQQTADLLLSARAAIPAHDRGHPEAFDR
jgi:hypothetical protein